MTAEVPELDWALLKRITARVTAEVPGICRVLPDTVSASPQDKATSEIAGITASEPSGSEAFFLHSYLGKQLNYSRMPLLGGTAEHSTVRE